MLKLEPPAGAALRRMPPFFGDDPHPEKSLFFLAMNLNKKGATVNLETAAGRELFRELIPHVDVVVESYRPGYLGDLGLGYEALEAINPALVMTSDHSLWADRAVQPVRRGRDSQLRHGADNEHQRAAGQEPLKHGGIPGAVRRAG